MADRTAIYLILFVFSALAGFSTFQVHLMLGLYTDIVKEIGNSFTQRDKRMLEINSRLHTLEEQRDLKQRLTNLEKSVRIFCLDGKAEMCGTLGPVDR